MSGFSFSEFFVLLDLALVGAIAILPYSFSLAQPRMAQAKLPKPVLGLLSVVQTGILMAIATFLGLLAARPSNLGAPVIKAALAGQPIGSLIMNFLPYALALAVVAFMVMAVFERFVFGPHVPVALRDSDVKTSAWKRFLASFYGGFDEEILMRLFIVSGLVWLLGRIWHNGAGLPANGAFWVAIILAAVLFGLGHLPTTRSLTPLTPLLVVRAIILNGLAGIAFGWLYWQYGIEAAMLSHFFADLLIHLLGASFASQVYQQPSK